MFAQRPQTVSVEVWAGTGRLSTCTYLIECAGRVTSAYFELTVLCIRWLNIFYLKYIFWPSSVFQSTCEELALLRYPFTLWFTTTVVIFNNIHHSRQLRIQFNPEVVQVSTKLFSNENMTRWFSLLPLWLWRSRTSVVITLSGSNCNCIYRVRFLRFF